MRFTRNSQRPNGVSLIESLTSTEVVFAASTGGHLAQLAQIAGWVKSSSSQSWVTFDSPQSRGLLGSSSVTFVPYIAPRDYKGMLRAVRPIFRSVRSSNASAVVSTGAAIALVALPIAKLCRRRAIYIESVSRFRGPSMSGRILRWWPGVETYTQHRSWSSRVWAYEFSVMDGWTGSRLGPELSNDVKSVFVTLGTIKPYRFDALIDRLLDIAPADIAFTWQLGVTSREGLPGSVHTQMSTEEFDAAVVSNDVVVTHAGVGTLMKLLELDSCIVAVPRRASHLEHVDDHQHQVADDYRNRELAVVVDADALAWKDICDAATIRVSREVPNKL